MKELSHENVKHVAHLARLEIKSEDEATFVTHLNKVLNYVELLGEVNTADVTPFFSLSKEHLEMYAENFMTHPDEISPSLPPQDLLRNAPQSQQNQFVVEAVIEDH